MDTRLEALLNARSVDRNDQFRPQFFRAADAEDRERLYDLLKEDATIQVFDALHGQLRELMRVLHPGRQFDAHSLEHAVEQHLEGLPMQAHGMWVFYPWSKRLVHILDEPAFVLVRTDRNRNKITREEQAVLAKKRVGVIGLSVGQSVSLTMALERSFGEIRLADMDTLDLSNLNRIRSGTHGLGANKAVNVAREIAEIDPYLKVTCFPEGINKGNIDRFLTDGGDLDLVVEECDSLDIKILARQEARKRGIPVVMDASDRGLIDVERFDLDPERPLLHGLLDDMDLGQFERPMTNAEKLPFMAKIVGMDTLSDRMKASLPEMGRTISTWPQLATGVILGGAIVGDIHRRIALDGFRGSGRWWNDLDDLISEARAAYPDGRNRAGDNTSSDHGQDHDQSIPSTE
ncbi:MAG: Rv1355c family protein [Flavobacteriales bacterium]|nr:Rv1355c family protein [Flavobacteriales bacterium]